MLTGFILYLIMNIYFLLTIQANHLTLKQSGL